MGIAIGPDNAAAIVVFPAVCVCVYAFCDRVCERDGQKLQVLNSCVCVCVGGGERKPEPETNIKQ